jgi:hypothetical protein
MKISDFANHLPKLLKMADPFVLHSEPGIGKSDSIDAARKLGWDVIWFHPVVCDPTDFKGMPFAFMQDNQPKAKFLPFNDLELLCTATKPTLACFDDLGQGPLAVQAAMMQLWLARRVNGHTIDDNVVFCGATNRAEDKAAVTGMIEPLKSRATLIPIEADIDDWCDWANIQAWMPPTVPAFLRFKTELLSAFKPTRDIKNTPNPRNWARLGKKIHHGLEDFELLAGDVGDGAASEYLAFKEVADELPDVDALLRDPEKAIVPENKPSVMYALMGALSHRANPTTAANLVTYLSRVPKEFSVLCMKDAFSRNKKNARFKSHKAITEWAVQHASAMCLAA